MIAGLEKFGIAAWRLARNPLGIIALFIVLVYGIAGLVLGVTASSLTGDQKTILVWFLVVFPFAVLGTFTWLVCNHHGKLYAPSDYRDDEAFLKSLQSLSPEVQRQRLDSEVAEITGYVHTADAESMLGPRDANNDASERDLRRRLLLGEELALRAIERELGVSINRQADLGGSFGVDGMFVRDGRGFAVEVKHILDRHLDVERIVDQVGAIVERVQRLRFRRFTIMLALVIDGQNAKDLEPAISSLHKAVGAFAVPVQLTLFDLAELKKEYGV